MISHKHKCIFVHIPKAAGTSIERFFMEDLGLDMDNRHALLLGVNTNTQSGPRRISHLLAKEYVAEHFISQDIFDSYYKFAFVRNPYERLISTYKYKKFNTYMSFDTYIKLKLDDLISSETEGFFFKTQYQYIYDESGQCLVDFVGRFENVELDFQIVKDKLAIAADLKHYNKSKPVNGLWKKISMIGRVLRDNKSWPYLSFTNTDFNLSEESKSKILKYYKIDFDTFNYKY